MNWSWDEQSLSTVMYENDSRWKYLNVVKEINGVKCYWCFLILLLWIWDHELSLVAIIVLVYHYNDPYARTCVALFPRHHQPNNIEESTAGATACKGMETLLNFQGNNRQYWTNNDPCLCTKHQQQCLFETDFYPDMVVWICVGIVTQ